jgi:hypothetical protein
MRPGLRGAALAVAALVVAAGVSGCGGSSENGVASKSPEAIVAASSEALQGVKSVHVSGNTESGSTPTQLNLSLVSGKGGRGEMSQNGLGFQIVAIGPSVYIKGSDAFWQHFGGEAAAQLFRGKWLKAPASGKLGSFASLTNLHALFTKLLSNHGTLVKGKVTTVNGQKVIAINDTTKGGTLYVATTGKPYPVEVVKKGGTESGSVAFDRFNESVPLSAPANSIDISQFH